MSSQKNIMNSSIWRLVHYAIHNQRHKYNKQRQGIGLKHLQLNVNVLELKINIVYLNLKLEILYYYIEEFIIFF